MRITFIPMKESTVLQLFLPDLITEALMQKMRRKESVKDENQANNNPSAPVQAMLNRLHHKPL